MWPSVLYCLYHFCIPQVQRHPLQQKPSQVSPVRTTLITWLATAWSNPLSNQQITGTDRQKLRLKPLKPYVNQPNSFIRQQQFPTHWPQVQPQVRIRFHDPKRFPHSQQKQQSLLLQMLKPSKFLINQRRFMHHPPHRRNLLHMHDLWGQAFMLQVHQVQQTFSSRCQNFQESRRSHQLKILFTSPRNRLKNLKHRTLPKTPLRPKTNFLGKNWKVHQRNQGRVLKFGKENFGKV